MKYVGNGLVIYSKEKKMIHRDDPYLERVDRFASWLCWGFVAAWIVVFIGGLG